MGLDITVLAKPAPGHEAEFERIWRTLNIADGKLPDPELERAGFLARWFGRRSRIDRDALIARFHEISVPPHAVLGAPIVGRDAAADEWLRGLFESGELNSGAATYEQALVAFDGHHAIEALPDCDGLPLYTHAGMYDGVNRTSFRGAFLESCEEIIGADLIARAWEPMLAPAFGAWAAALRQHADAFAAENGLVHVLGDRHAGVDVDGADGHLHIVDQAARWAHFWSARAHGSEPYF